MLSEIPDHLDYGLQVIFVGFNPSIRSAETGHHYANPRNNFWRILHSSGLTPRLYHAYEDGELLKLGFGFTNIVARPTRGIDELSRSDYEEGRHYLTQKLEKYRPKVVCFVGKGVYTAYSFRKKADWGFQTEPLREHIQEFVAPSSSGLVRMRMEQIVGIYHELASTLLWQE